VHLAGPDGQIDAAQNLFIADLNPQIPYFQH
jgi:hypothetical protein